MANRADLSSRCKKTKMCKFFIANACQRGSSCAYAHSEKELRATPDLQCTMLCPQVLAGRACDIARCRFAHSNQELRKFPGAESSRAKADHDIAMSKLTESMANQWNGIHSVADMAQNVARLKQAQEAIEQALASLEGRLAGPAKCPISRASKQVVLSRVSTSSQLNIEALSESEYACETVLDQPASSIEPEGTTLRGLEPACGFGCQEQACGQAKAGSFIHQISQHPDQANVHGDSVSESSDFERQVSTQSESIFSHAHLGMQKTAFGPVFGRQVSDFGSMFGRHMSYSSPPNCSSENGEDMYAPLGLCVKNTFLTIEEEDQESKRPASRRSQSAPARCAQCAPKKTRGDSADAKRFSSEPVQQMQNSTCVANMLPGPLPIGEVKPAQSGHVLLGRLAKDNFPLKDGRARQVVGKAVHVF